MDVVRKYSPPECVATFAKMIDIADSIFLGENQADIMQFKGLFRYANINESNADFAYTWLNFPFALQSKIWIPCLQKYDNLEGCRTLTASTVLYPKAEKFKDTVKAIITKSKWANETEPLTTAFLNYIGFYDSFRKDNSTATPNRRSIGLVDPSDTLHYETTYLAYSYQQCTEWGLFITGNAPVDTSQSLPVISRLITLHYLRNKLCRNQLYLNLTEIPVSSNLNRYGAYNLSYPRLMLTGGEVDPVCSLIYNFPTSIVAQHMSDTISLT